MKPINSYLYGTHRKLRLQFWKPDKRSSHLFEFELTFFGYNLLRIVICPPAYYELAILGFIFQITD